MWAATRSLTPVLAPYSYHSLDKYEHSGQIGAYSHILTQVCALRRASLQVLLFFTFTGQILVKFGPEDFYENPTRKSKFG